MTEMMQITPKRYQVSPVWKPVYRSHLGWRELWIEWIFGWVRLEEWVFEYGAAKRSGKRRWERDLTRRPYPKFHAFP